MTKGKPKQDGSGKGRRLNKDRSGCKTTKKTGQGQKLNRNRRRYI